MVLKMEYKTTLQYKISLPVLIPTSMDSKFYPLKATIAMGLPKWC